ncbi:MAG: arsenite methyltransferase [Halobacteriales archaeon]|nr:arsenite methyltransferase [Halobacteriales archaeon]
MSENRDADARELSPEEQRGAVRERYGSLARADEGGCCGGDTDETASTERLGYDDEDASVAPEAADISLGCGNPEAIANLEEGEKVVDLGSGGGFDCFLAADEVGDEGRVVGVDMTPEMVEKARATAAENGFGNVEFRLGEIENLPTADESFDVLISNCVINLSPDKRRVFEEAYRVLRPGGRVAVSDIVRTGEIPDALVGDLDAVSACVAGAESPEHVKSLLSDAGFVEVTVEPEADAGELVDGYADEFEVPSCADVEPSEVVAPARITAKKPE